MSFETDDEKWKLSPLGVAAVGDTFNVDGQIYEVVECLEDGTFRLNNGDRDVFYTEDELRQVERLSSP